MKVTPISKKVNGELKLSANFKAKEFACKDGSDVFFVDMDFVKDKLQSIRNWAKAPITINSAYRTYEYNKRIGGAANSYHVKGRAFDIVVAGKSVKEVAKYAESIGILGIMRYDSKGFVHIDSRETKYFAIVTNGNTVTVNTFGDAKPAINIGIAGGTRKGIDVAKWNDIKDYAAVKNDGVQFAIPKVINKSNNPDDSFEKHYTGFTNNGIPIIGGYNYLYTPDVYSARKSIDAFIKVSNGRIPIYWADIEDDCMKGLGLRLVDIIKALKDTAEANGMKFGIYTGSYFYKTFIKPYLHELPNDIEYWIARYYASNRQFRFTDEANNNYKPLQGIYGWQYTSKGNVNGIKGNTDLNLIYK